MTQETKTTVSTGAKAVTDRPKSEGAQLGETSSAMMEDEKAPVVVVASSARPRATVASSLRLFVALAALGVALMIASAFNLDPMAALGTHVTAAETVRAEAASAAHKLKTEFQHAEANVEAIVKEGAQDVLKGAQATKDDVARRAQDAGEALKGNAERIHADAKKVLTEAEASVWKNAENAAKGAQAMKDDVVRHAQDAGEAAKGKAEEVQDGLKKTASDATASVKKNVKEAVKRVEEAL